MINRLKLGFCIVLLLSSAASLNAMSTKEELKQYQGWAQDIERIPCRNAQIKAYDDLIKSLQHQECVYGAINSSHFAEFQSIRIASQNMLSRLVEDKMYAASANHSNDSSKQQDDNTVALALVNLSKDAND